MCYTQIQVLPAGSETSLFKQFFIDWRDKDETTGPRKPYTIGRIAKVEQVPFDASSLHSNSTMAAQHCMVDDGKGKVEVRVVSLVASLASTGGFRRRAVANQNVSWLPDLAC